MLPNANCVVDFDDEVSEVHVAASAEALASASTARAAAALTALATAALAAPLAALGAPAVAGRVAAGLLPVARLVEAAAADRVALLGLLKASRVGKLAERQALANALVRPVDPKYFTGGGGGAK